MQKLACHNIKIRKREVSFYLKKKCHKVTVLQKQTAIKSSKLSAKGLHKTFALVDKYYEIAASKQAI